MSFRIPIALTAISFGSRRVHGLSLEKHFLKGTSSTQITICNSAQLRHIQVGVIREESRAQVATLLMSKDPAAVFTDMNVNKGKKRLKPENKIPQEIAKKIDFNQELMEKYGFFSTPSIVWRDSKGTFKSAQGMPKDLKEIFEK